MYGLLRKSGAEAIMEYAKDVRFLGGLPVVLGLLQTWNNRLDYHPHCHFIVSNGGCAHSGYGEWVNPRNRKHWIPTKQVMFRAKEIFLKHLWKERPDLYPMVNKIMQKRHWKYDCQPYGDFGVDHATNLKKLVRYVKRDALAGHRIISIDDVNVSIRYKDSSGQYVTERINAVTYIQKYMWHVLPKNFHQAESYGLAHSSKSRQLKKVRQQFESKCRNGGGVIDAWQNSEPVNDETSMSNNLSSRCGRCGSQTLKSNREFFENPFVRRQPYFSYTPRAPDIPPLN